jgi:hypothetical protein
VLVLGLALEQILSLGTIITVMANVTNVDIECLRSDSIQDFPEQIAVLQNAGQPVNFVPRLREIEVSGDTMQVLIGAYEKSFQTG